MALFRGRIRRWREDKPGGLAVIDIPLELAAELGGRRQTRVTGTLNGVPFTGSTMLVAGGGFCVGVSRAALKASGVSVGDDVDVQLGRADSGHSSPETAAMARTTALASPRRPPASLPESPSGV